MAAKSRKRRVLPKQRRLSATQSDTRATSCGDKLLAGVSVCAGHDNSDRRLFEVVH